MATEFNIAGNPLVIEVKDYQISSTTYRLETGYNNRSGWYLSIYDSFGDPMLLGLNIISESQNLTWRHKASIPGMFDGNIWAINRTGDDTITLTENNFGEGKDWGLFHFTDAEEESLGIKKN